MILEPQNIKSVTVSPSICHEVMGLDAMILVSTLYMLLMLEKSSKVCKHFSAKPFGSLHIVMWYLLVLQWLSSYTHIEMN